MSVFSVTSQSNVEVAEREKKLKTELPCKGLNKLCSFVGFPPPHPVSLQLILKGAQFSTEFSGGVVVFTTNISIFMILKPLKHLKKAIFVWHTPLWAHCRCKIRVQNRAALFWTQNESQDLERQPTKIHPKCIWIRAVLYRINMTAKLKLSTIIGFSHYPNIQAPSLLLPQTPGQGSLTNIKQNIF